MLIPQTGRVVAVGEAMLELAPLGDGMYRKGFAGDTFNTAWHMAQLMGERAAVGYVSRVGTDTLSDAFLRELVEDGIDTTGISRDPQRGMGLYLIELQGVERSFHYWRNASAAKGLADDPAVLKTALDGAGLIHLSGITLAILPAAARETLYALLADLRQGGCKVSFDPNIRPRLWASADEARQAVTQMLRITDIALPSFDDEAGLWGDTTPEATLARLAGSGVDRVVVKNGAAGVSFLAGGQTGLVPTPPVKGILDTTGAGDAFNAGYLSASLCGQSEAQAIATGQAMASLVLRTHGARASKADMRVMAGMLI